MLFGDLGNDRGSPAQRKALLTKRGVNYAEALAAWDEVEA